MARLLVVHHTPSPALQAVLEAVKEGVALAEGTELVLRPALSAGAADLLAADGVLLGTPANIGYMSGALKHFFDSTFLAVGGALGDDGQGAGASGPKKPFGLYVHGRYDTTGAVRSVQTIAGALPWRQGFDVLEVLGDVTDSDREAAYELGGTLAALALEQPERQ